MKKIMFNDRYGLTGAVLRGDKTMTRRLIGCYEDVKAFHAIGGWAFIADTMDGDSIEIKPAYEEGETVAIAQSYRDVYDEFLNSEGSPVFDAFLNADEKVLVGRGFENKMFVRAGLMPHRIIISDIDVQRIQDISDDDCTREGIQTDTQHFAEWQGQHGFRDREKNVPMLFQSRRDAFASLMSKIGRKSDWDANPWVFVYSFKLIR